MTNEQTAPENKTQKLDSDLLEAETAKSESTESASKAKTLLQQAPVTAALFAANMIVFILLVFLTSARSILIPTEQILIDWGANFGPVTLCGEPWRIITSTFLHASIVHLALNLYVLFNLGPYAENLLGSKRMFALYFLAGVTGSLFSLIWNPFQISAGASGALFGLFGCFVEESVLGSGFTVEEIFRPARVMLLFAVVISCVYGAFIPGIDNAAHLGGFLAGALLSHFFRQDLKVSWNKRDSAVVGLSLTALILGTSIKYFSVRTNPQFLAMHDNQSALPLIKERKYKEALTYLNLAASRYKDMPLLLRLSIVNCHLRRYDVALKNCEDAVALFPKNPDALIARAYVYQQRGDENLAIESANMAIKLDERYAPSYNARAWIFASFGKLQNSIDDSTKALSINPNYAAAFDTRGLAYFLAEQNQLSFKDLTKGIEIGNEPAGAFFHRALLFERLGKPKEAAADRFEAERLHYEPEPWEEKLSVKGVQH